MATDPRILYPVDGLDEDEIETLVDGGAIETVSADGCLYATLTPYSAATLSLKVAEIGSDYRWVAASHQPKQRRGKHNRKRVDLESLDSADLADKRASTADTVASINESIGLAFPAPRKVSDSDLSGRNLPRPGVLLTGCQPWVRERWGACPACNGSRLRPSTYCLVCDRWGLDWLLTKIWAAIERAKEKAEKETKTAKFKAKKKREKVA